MSIQTPSKPSSFDQAARAGEKVEHTAAFVAAGLVAVAVYSLGDARYRRI